MALDDRKLWGEAHRDLPGTAYTEGQTTPLRSTKRGELFTQSIAKGQTALVEEGSYFLATNPTPGTGIAGIAAANGYDATEALCTIRNGATAGDTAKRLYIDYIKLQLTVAGTNGTNLTYATHKDKGNSRWASGGTAYTPVNMNMGSDLSSSASVHFGALVTDAATADVAKMQSGNLRTAIGVVGDEIILDCGGSVAAGPSSLFEGTLICKQVIKHIPIVLNPGEELVLTVNAASQSVGTSFEFEICYWER
jgi:hypothetical protein